MDLAIAVHIANGNKDYCDFYRPFPGNTVPMFRVPTVIACFTYFMSEVPQLFPKLRWGFIEASSEWIPWIYREVESRYQATGKKVSPKTYFKITTFLSPARRTTTFRVYLTFPGSTVWSSEPITDTPIRQARWMQSQSSMSLKGSLPR